MFNTFHPYDPVYAQRQAADPEKSVWVSASAGSGKTKILVDRVLNLLLGGVRPERILCLTFTKAAATEMYNRVNQRLLQWATIHESDLASDLSYFHGRHIDIDIKSRARRLFAKVLDSGLRIETLHSFCHTLLKRFPLEAGVAHYFQVMDECETVEAMAITRNQVLLDICAGTDPVLTGALHTITAFVHETHLHELIDDLLESSGRLQRFFDKHNGVDGAVTAIYDRLAVSINETPMNILAKACVEEAYDSQALLIAAAALQAGSKADAKKGNVLASWLTEQTKRVENFDNYLNIFFTSEGTMRKTLITKKSKATSTVTDVLAAEAKRLALVEDKRRHSATAEATSALLRLGATLLATYRSYKKARALLDYDDLILITRSLLERVGQAEWILFKLDSSLDHLLIDEAQDISAEQWAIIEILTSEFFADISSRNGCQESGVRTVFAVGDSKQSIYSFQGASPDHFDSMRTLLRGKAIAAQQMWADVSLSVSFRSAPAVLKAVDAVFALDQARDGVALDDEIHHTAFRLDQYGLVEIWPLVEPVLEKSMAPWEPFTVYLQQNEAPAMRLARLVAHRISTMINGNDWLDSHKRPVRASDIMVLVRYRSSFVENLVRFLKSFNVPVIGVDRMILSKQIAVIDLIALGKILLLPEDDLTLAAVLKCPLIGFNEDELFALAHSRGSNTLWRALADHSGTATVFGCAYDWLSELLTDANQRRPYELYTHILGPLNGRRKLVTRLGQDAGDAIDEFLTMTLRYEASHLPSLQGFLHWLENTQVEVKRDLEQGVKVEAVRISTVHMAKGLQTPIIFMPDTVQAPTKTPHLLWESDADDLMLWFPSRKLETHLCDSLRGRTVVARDREYRRLLYVAMTRAEDRLYICGWKSSQAKPSENCWYNLIYNAIAPISSTEVDTALSASGLLSSTEVLRLTSAQNQRTKDIIRELPIESRRRTLPMWSTTKLLHESISPHSLIPSQLNEESLVSSPLLYNSKKHLGRGRLVHMMLQGLPDLPVKERLSAAQHYLDHTATDITLIARTTLAAEVVAILEHHTVGTLFNPGSQAEVAVMGVVGTHIVSSQVDRLIVSDKAVIIADYKTDRLPPQQVEETPGIYMQQIAAYRAILATIYPGRSIDCLLVWTEALRVMLLPEELLDSIFQV